MEIVIEIVLEIVVEIMIEIWNKHGYFNITGSTTPIFVIEIVIEFFRTSSARYEKF